MKLTHTLQLSMLVAIAIMAGCKGKDKSNSDSIVGNDNGTFKSLDLLPVRDMTDAPFSSQASSDKNVAWGEYLVRTHFFALVECEGADGKSAEQVMQDVEAQSLAEGLFVDPRANSASGNQSRALFVGDASNKSYIKCKLRGSRLLTYAMIAQQLSDYKKLAASSGSSADESAYLLAQSVYLAMRGTYYPGQPITGSRRLGKFSTLAKEASGGGTSNDPMMGAISRNDLAAQMALVDKDLDPCSQEAASSPFFAKERGKFFACVEVGGKGAACTSSSAACNFAAGGADGSKYASVRDTLASQLAVNYNKLYPIASVASPHEQLYNVLTTTVPWTSISADSELSQVALYLAHQPPAGFSWENFLKGGANLTGASSHSASFGLADTHKQPNGGSGSRVGNPGSQTRPPQVAQLPQMPQDFVQSLYANNSGLTNAWIPNQVNQATTGGTFPYTGNQLVFAENARLSANLGSYVGQNNYIKASDQNLTNPYNYYEFKQTNNGLSQFTYITNNGDTNPKTFSRQSWQQTTPAQLGASGVTNAGDFVGKSNIYANMSDYLKDPKTGTVYAGEGQIITPGTNGAATQRAMFMNWDTGNGIQMKTYAAMDPKTNNGYTGFTTDSRQKATADLVSTNNNLLNNGGKWDSETDLAFNRNPNGSVSGVYQAKDGRVYTSNGSGLDESKLQVAIANDYGGNDMYQRYQTARTNFQNGANSLGTDHYNPSIPTVTPPDNTPQSAPPASGNPSNANLPSGAPPLVTMSEPDPGLDGSIGGGSSAPTIQDTALYGR